MIQQKSEEIYRYINNLEKENKVLRENTVNYTTITQITNQDMKLHIQELEKTIENQYENKKTERTC